ncbi:hypothetical protein GCM10008955_38720 [Deinococcus malanensis]|uniref:Uncharacterized protein n=1 Tax=Deinococcus malanensis TaxID=1706855 RepID=A0ABQ2F1D8_9DEIO|nr:hypothetical protein [Deinococcus malanensis]GGK41173.1 hypothetical protein GCM10008955_38720 [Deinococcus malanensis]
MPTSRVAHQRDEAPVGQLTGALNNLLDHYGREGHRVLRILAQEPRYPALSPCSMPGAAATVRGWNEPSHPGSPPHPALAYEALVTQLAVLTDVHTCTR